jgi:hypothetical protein
LEKKIQEKGNGGEKEKNKINLEKSKVNYPTVILCSVFAVEPATRT